MSKYPLVWDPATEVVYDAANAQERCTPKEFDSVPWSGPLSREQREELKLFDVRNDVMYRIQRLKQVGATLGRDACGFGYRKSPHDVALITAGHKARTGADKRLQQVFAYGHFFEEVAKEWHAHKTGFEIKPTGFWANPSFVGPGDKDAWFADNWPFLHAGHSAEHEALDEQTRGLVRHMYEERRDAVVDAHWLVATPDAIVDTHAFFDSFPDEPTHFQKKLAELHDPDVYGFVGVGEGKSHINDTFSAFSNRGAQIQMAFQALCMMHDQTYETGVTIPWGHLISNSCVTPLSRYWKRPVSRPLYHIDGWKISFTGHQLFFELMEVMRRFKETVDTMHGKSLVEAVKIPFDVDTAFSTDSIQIEHIYTDLSDSITPVS